MYYYLNVHFQGQRVNLENCALLGCYAASSADVRRQPTGPILRVQESKRFRNVCKKFPLLAAL